MTSTILYRWPPAARFGRVVPKTKFYEHARVSASGRERFVAEVQRITWAYKLADVTIHLSGSDEVPEIQVFLIDAKGDDVSDAVLAAIDKAVPFPIIFEVNRTAGGKAQTRMVATLKRLRRAGFKTTGYFTTSWLPGSTPRRPLPTALDLTGLYAALLAPLLPLTPVPAERLSETTIRVEQARRLERDIAALERRMSAEPQLNRKIELRRQARTLAAALAKLTDPERPSAEESLGKDAPWRS